MEEDEMIDFGSDQIEALEDRKRDDKQAIPENSMTHFVQNRFQRAEDKKRYDESRFVEAYTNFRGLPGGNKFTEAERSRVFIKVTKTKVQAAYSQLTEVLFGNGRFPLTVDKTVLPDGVVDDVSFDPQVPAAGNKAPLFGTRDGPALPKGATQHSLSLGPLDKKLEPIKDRLVLGPSGSPSAVTFSPADVAAKKMEKKIHDQLEESDANKHLRMASFDCALFGTGILKGPFAVDKEYPNWTEDGEYEPVIKTMPMLGYVSVWNAYPDPDATNMDECEYFIERHKMARSQLRALNKRPHFRKNAINNAIEYGSNYERKDWESVMEDGAGHPEVDRWEVLEYWGYVPRDILEEHGVTIPRTLKDLEEINTNVWICNGEVLRLVLNPFKPTRIPYHAVPYEINPYSFFGIGIAENMSDTQTLMNGFMRLAVDNAVLSGNLILEVDENNLSPGQDLEIVPGKVFKRQGGAPGQAIFATEFPNVSAQNLQLFDKARQLADEATGFPSFAHGQTGVTGVGRTASGISMLMNAANGNTRSVVKNLDDYLITPLGKAYFAFNMQFDHDKDIKGDLEVNARGMESLMVNEVRSQRLMQFLQIVSANPALTPWAKLDVIIKEIAKSLDLDPDRICNSMPDAILQAEILKSFAPPTGPAGAAGGQATAAAGVASGPGSGGGTIGTGDAPAPGAAGFSANTGEQPQ